ncbi:MAG: adenosine deaminase [Erysipelotrichaceae bacterium]|nr:adenosine deaminase [Erysipelotrichaceae bacterium]
MNLGKVELHLHLDGSLDMETAYRLAKERNVIDETWTYDQFKTKMMVPSDNPSLEECLKCFDFPIAIMQDKEALSECTYTLIRNLNELGLIYAEIRFAPQVHCQKGLSQDEVIEAVLDGKKRAEKDFPNIKTGIINCCMTYGNAKINEEANLETIRATKRFLGKGVVAADLAGAEGLCPILDFKPLFDLAKELEVPYTIHAGEAGPASFVKDAMDMGAWRIGHGGHCTEDPEVLQEVIDKGIVLEVCPTSNIQCHCQPSYEEHAIIELFRKGAHVTINSDNMTLSRVNTHSEIDKAMTLMGFSEADIRKMTEYAIQAAFLSDEEKAELMKKI